METSRQSRELRDRWTAVIADVVDFPTPLFFRFS